VELVALTAVAAAIAVLGRPPLAPPTAPDLSLMAALALMASLTRVRRLGPWRVDATAVTPAFFVAALALLGVGAALACVAAAALAEAALGELPRGRGAAVAVQAAAVLAAASVARALGAGVPMAPTLALVAAAATYALVWQALEMVGLARLRRLHPAARLGLFERAARAVLLGLAGASLALLWQVGPLGFACGVLSLVFLNREVSSSHFGRETLVEPKTGLFNARYFQEVLESEVERSRRLDRPVALVMCDLDHLRDVNNAHGHATGDVVIRQVADLIRAETRSIDVPARFGGEEFAILLPETTARRARAIAERLRRGVEAVEFAAIGPTGRPAARRFKVSLSIGIAAFPESAATAEGLIGGADAAAYEAKRRGRNRVEVFAAPAAGLVDREAVPDPGHRVDVARLL